MTFIWYHWAILGVLLVLSELVIPTLVLIWFGIGALVIAVCLAIVPDMGLISQLLIWCLVSVLSTLCWFKFFKPMRDKTFSGRSSAAVIGEIGLLVNDVDKFQRGKVRFQAPVVGSDSWECMADEPITAGSRVKVVSIEGSLLKVISAEKNT